jgi:hypothetical protein
MQDLMMTPLMYHDVQIIQSAETSRTRHDVCCGTKCMSFREIDG